jgi:ribosomal protein L29
MDSTVLLALIHDLKAENLQLRQQLAAAQAQQAPAAAASEAPRAFAVVPREVD